MRKFGEIDTVVALILFCVVLVVFFAISKVYLPILGMFGNKLVCEQSFVASSISKTISIVGKPYIDPKCQTRRITVTEDDDTNPNPGTVKLKLLNNLGETSFSTYKNIVQWNLEHGDVSNYPYFNEEGVSMPSSTDNLRYNSDDEKIVERYNMDKLVADELVNCWDIVGQGKLDLFDNWFDFVDCGGDQPCNSITHAILSPISNDKIRISRNFCVLCSRIRFDEAVKEKFIPERGVYDSVNVWMYNHPWRIGESESYYEYITVGSTQDADKEEFDYFTAPYYTYTPQEAYAVIFVRVNYHQGIITAYKTGKLAKSALNGIFDIPTGIGISLNDLGGKIKDEILLGKTNDDEFGHANMLVLIPYEELPNYCDYVAGAYI
jgi:hypothetical protein